MDWFKVMFVLVTVNRLDCIQNEVVETENISIATEILESTSVESCQNQFLDLTLTGCRHGDNLILKFNRNESVEETPIITKIENSEDDKCYKFRDFNGSFVANTSWGEPNNVSFCKSYKLLSEFNEIYYLNGLEISKVENKCPSEKEICVMGEKLVTDDISSSSNEEAACLLRNFTVGLLYNDEFQYINLKISWDEIDEDRNVSVTIISKADNLKLCTYEAHIFSHSLFNNSIVKPGVPSETEIEPGCVYDIFINSVDSKEENKINCIYVYTVPDCVKNKCDCDKFKPQPRISHVAHISGDRFLITWDPGQKTINNSSYTNKEVDFKYILSQKVLDIMADSATTIRTNMDKYTTEIKMKLHEKEKYKLIGQFKNNFSCSAQADYYFTAPEKGSNTGTIVVFITVGLFIILIAMKYRTLIRYKNKILNCVIPSRRNAERELQELAKLHVPQISMIANDQYPPLEFSDAAFDEFEFPRSKITLKERIGVGAFGQVYLAKAIGIGGNEGYRMVAVKILGHRENMSRETANDLLAEIEIFKQIENFGRHPNIVALLGCCTVDVPYMMIMEFIPCGSLKDYLEDLRKQWLIKRSAAKNREENDDGAYIEPQTPTTPVSITSSRLPSTSETVSTSLDDPMTPVLAHFNYALDRVLDHMELQNFALQIARGMAHLEKIPITHRDLAARNILIDEFKTLKISDFGLSRHGPYINQTTKKLPLRWMAIEAIVDHKYDNRSDVWSFGVVLWEIGTLGAFPYKDVPDSFVQQYLQIGNRLQRPEICTDELYSLMTECWAAEPDARPTFQELVDALDVKNRKIYVNFNQLNPTYVFPPSDIEKCTMNLVRVVDIDVSTR